MRSLASLGNVLVRQKKLREAEAIFWPMWPVAERVFGPESVDVLDWMDDVVAICNEVGNFEEAEKLSRRIL